MPTFAEYALPNPSQRKRTFQEQNHRAHSEAGAAIT
jgi:hypothetical protein